MPDSLVARIMKAKYNPECSILEAPLKNKPSYAWRSIQGSCSLLREGLVWKVGDGRKVRIWHDKRLLNSSTFRVQSAPIVLDS
jgi:hypothetical protein